MNRCAPVKALMLSGLVLALAGAGCTPTVQMKAPDEPITINLNVQLEADVRMQLEEKAQRDIEQNPEVF